VKRAILGENNARLYAFTAAQRVALAGDPVTRWRAAYDAHGEGRTNLAYGYANKA
jgi:hypothetical protein